MEPTFVNPFDRFLFPFDIHGLSFGSLVCGISEGLGNLASHVDLFLDRGMTLGVEAGGPVHLPC